MAKSTDEIYDLLVELRQEVRVYSATNNLRVTRLEERVSRGWQFWTAMLGSPLFGAALAFWGIKTGA